MASSSTNPSGEPQHQPYVPDSTIMPELTWPAIIVGALLGIIFGASSLYLVLKIGMTVSASIPVAVLSITLFRVLSRTFGMRRTTILENNVVQTTGSAGESIAFGVGVTMPALMLLGFDMNVGRVLVVASLGGLLGILMMIPLRRAFIVKKHHELKYPEGTACADVLIVGEKGGATAKTVFVGFGIAFFYQFLVAGMKLFKDIPEKSLKFFKGATPGLEANPVLLGVGYIIGTRIAFVMAAGGVLATFVLIPAIRFFGEGLTTPLDPGTKLIREMNDAEIWKQYVLYIGAGAVAAGGIISLFQALPLILQSIKSGIQDIRGSRDNGAALKPRTDQDMPMWIVGAGALFLVLAIWSTTFLHQIIPAVPDLNMNLLGALLIVLFGFLFVTVSSRLTGEVGSSSNPISGMTVATLLITCGIFVLMGWTGDIYCLTAISVAAVVCVASSNGGTTSQDLKTGYLVGGTPKAQQWSILVGSLTSALVIGVVLIVINDNNTVYTRKPIKDLPTPKVPIEVGALKDTDQAPEDQNVYKVLRVREGNKYGLPPGQYLVDDQAQIKYLKDPGINGKYRVRDNGTPVQKFDAPKATLFAYITNGILNGKLPWALVLLGVSIAVVLEFCGVPSLPFAVGVYLPISASTPILFGGLARLIVDKRNSRKSNGSSEGNEDQSDAEAEMSPGVLMSTGYIAGGAIAGVLISFLAFNDKIPSFLAQWQHRETKVKQESTMRELSMEAARDELGLTRATQFKTDVNQIAAGVVGLSAPTHAMAPFSTAAYLQSIELRDDLRDTVQEVEDLNGELQTEYLKIPAKTKLKLPVAKGQQAAQPTIYEVPADTYLGEIAKEKSTKAELLLNLNEALAARIVLVPRGAKLILPDDKTYEAMDDVRLGDVAQETLKDVEMAEEILKLNEELAPEQTIPEGAIVKLPQRNWPSLLAFGVLMALLIAVGCGWLLREKPIAEVESKANAPQDE